MTPEGRKRHTEIMKSGVRTTADQVHSVLVQLVGERGIRRDHDGGTEEAYEFFEVFESSPLLFIAVQWTGYIGEVPQPLEVCVGLTDMERNAIGRQTSMVNPIPQQWYALITAGVMARNFRSEP